MGKHLAKGQDGKWRDNQGQGNIYHGHVNKDLEIGDRYDEHDHDKNKTVTFEIKNKQQLESGHLVIHSIEVNE